MAARTRESWWCCAFGPAPSAPPSPFPAPKAEKDGVEDELPSVLRKIEKWGDYAAVGGVVPTADGAGFIPMKTPLTSKQMASLVEGGKRIEHPHSLLKFVADQALLGRRVGLVIDLTCHDCLYSEELASAPGLSYVHLATPAKQFVEPWLVQRLADEARAVWRKDPQVYVAVHCSYGFNRTGFTLCSYLAQVDGVAIDDALATFKRARPPGVKHGYFEEELRRRYPGRLASPVVNIERVPGSPKAAGSQDEPGSLSTTPQLHGADENGDLPIRRCKQSTQWSPTR